MTSQAQTVDIGGLRVRWEEQGEGRPVIFLHGIPTGPGLWRKVLPRLSGVRCLAFEMVGYAGSIGEGIGQDLSVAAQAEYVKRWMDALDLERAALVGHDLGGGIAQILAVRYRPRVEGFVLINSISHDSWPIRSVSAIARAGSFIEKLPNAAVRELLRTIYWRGHDAPALAKEAMEVHWPHYERSPDGAGSALVRQARALDPRDTLAVSDRLPELDLPVRIVWGAGDRFQKVSWARRLARELSAPLDRLLGAKHFVPEDHPDRVASAVEALLDEIRWREGRATPEGPRPGL